MGDISDKMSGKAKKTMGKMTNNKQQELQGKAIEERGKMKDKAEDTINRHRDLDDRVNL